jgi:hypothetical protein
MRGMVPCEEPAAIHAHALSAQVTAALASNPPITLSKPNAPFDRTSEAVVTALGHVAKLGSDIDLFLKMLENANAFGLRNKLQGI